MQVPTTPTLLNNNNNLLHVGPYRLDKTLGKGQTGIYTNINN